MPIAFETAFHDALENIQEQLPGAGANLCFCDREGKRYSFALGHRDWMKQDSMPDDQSFAIYSITKTYIAVLMLKLVEANRFDLQWPVCRWFPELPHAKTLTLHMLLQHSSGIPNYTDMDSYHQAVQSHPRHPWSNRDVIDKAVAQPWSFEPGQSWAYSNTGYRLLAEIIEQQCQSSIHELMQRLICAPLGLSQTVFPQGFVPQVPGWSNYLSQGDMQDVSAEHHPFWAGGAGGMVATASDVAQFYHQLLVDKTVLSAQGLSVLQDWVAVPGEHPPGIHPYYGLGIAEERATRFGDIQGHAGGGPGYSSLARFLPEHQMTAVVLCNSEFIDPGAILYPLLDGLLKS